MITLTVNGSRHEVDIDPATPLLYVLRDTLAMHGAKYGCGLGQCGACTVMLDGVAIFSCLTPAGVLENRQIKTIEGLGTAENPGPLQQAFIDEQAAQCGYCIAGMIMRAQALLEKTTQPTEAQIRAQMQPNLCRCGTHTRILAAIPAPPRRCIPQPRRCLPGGPSDDREPLPPRLPGRHRRPHGVLRHPGPGAVR